MATMSASIVLPPPPPLLSVFSFCNMESMANEDKKKLHIAMFPWLAFGHMIPFLQLSKLLAQKGHRISFISTPRNIDRLPKLPPKLSHLIGFVKLPLPQVPDLPQDFESTADVLPEHLPLLENAYDLLREPFADILLSSRPDWILFDFSPYWVPDVARSLSIPSAFFSIFMACCTTYVSPPSGDEDRRRRLEDFTQPPSWIPFPSTNAFRNFEAKVWLPSEVLDETRVSAFDRFRETIKRCDIVAVRTCVELEQEWLQLLERIHKKPVIPVGVLSPNSWSATEEEEPTWEPIKQWLDEQNRGSVVYIAFGTEAKPSPEQLNEIALGLELSGLPFFWVLKNPNELPDGFLDRTRGKGIVFTNWAPQLKILAHESVGGFLTHSGWSSVVEAVQFEKPMVLLPMGNDQGLNAKLFQEKKMGFMMPRDEYDGSFTGEVVGESLKMVIVEEEGKIYRDRVKEMKGLLGLGNGDKQNVYLDNFLTRLRTHKL